jgi:hypothetical protein
MAISLRCSSDSFKKPGVRRREATVAGDDADFCPDIVCAIERIAPRPMSPVCTEAQTTSDVIVRTDVRKQKKRPF